MRLHEWKDSNGNKINITSNKTSAPVSTSSGSYKKRIEKLLDYHIAHRGSMVKKFMKDVEDTGFHYTEFREDILGDADVRVDIVCNISKADGQWGFTVFRDSKRTTMKTGSGWDTLVWELSFYLNLPTRTSSPEYQDLLTEWVDSNGNKININSSVASKATSAANVSYKKLFEKLIKYHIDHASSELERVNNKVINEYDFHLSEHYNTGSDEFNRTIIVSVNKYTNEFFLSIFVDGKEVYHNVYKSYEELLEILANSYMFLPSKGTKEYEDLLTESLSFAEDFKLYENLWENI